MKLHQAILLVALVGLSGCASGGVKNPETAACTELNSALGDNAKAISDVAISRGNVDSLSIPFWIPGGKKAVSVITGRQTAKIERLKAEQTELDAARNRRCPRPAS